MGMRAFSGGMFSVRLFIMDTIYRAHILRYMELGVLSGIVWLPSVGYGPDRMGVARC